jgi:hypothetical protein
MTPLREKGRTMVVNVNENWRIVSDEQCWSVQERRKSNRRYKDGWRSLEWHAQPHEALVALSERRIRRLSGTVQENAEELRRIVDELKAVASRVEAALAGRTVAA